MENIIIFGIIIVSVIVNIVKNYKKESEKNSKRVIIGKKPQQLNAPASNNSEVYPRPSNPTEAYESLEYNSQTNQNQPNTEDLYISDYIAQYDAEMEELTENRSDEASCSSINIAFETTDELKKAVLYSTILERKF